MRPIARLELLLRLVSWLSWKDAVSPKQELPSKPWSFCVTEDGLFLILNYKMGNIKIYERNGWSFCVTDDGIFLNPDYLAGNVKLYEQNGEVLEFFINVGSKGYDPDQFVKPAFCSFNKTENKFVILDMGTRRIYLYDRNEHDEFVREKKDKRNEVYGECPRGAYDIQLLGNRLFVAGHTSSGDKFYNFYSTDLSELKDSSVIKAKPKLLLSSKEIYRIDKSDDFVERIGVKYLEAIGVRNYFDIEGNFAYFVWMGDLRVTKVDISSDSKVGDSFGKKTRNYVHPGTSKIKDLANTFYLMVRNRESRDKYFRERRKFSIIRNPFTTPEHVILVYEETVKWNKPANFRLQFYALDGQLVRKVPIPDQPARRTWFDKERDLLYSLSGKKREEVKNKERDKLLIIFIRHFSFKGDFS